MERYECLLTNRFKRSFRKLPSEVKERVLAAIEELTNNPFLGHFITTLGVWSFRVGDYRVLYDIDREKREIILLTVRHRRRAYC